MEIELFDTVNGEKIYKYTITNGRISLSALDYGATIQSFIVPDKEGRPTDIVLGFNSIGEYEKYAYFGAVVGRVSGRIKDGRFTLNGKEYNLDKNQWGNCLHGGSEGFHKKIWFINNQNCYDDQLSFTYVSEDGENGFPGELFVSVTYTLTEDDSLRIEYSAKCDGDTIVSLTNHSFFNIGGDTDRDVRNTYVYIKADKIIPLGERMNILNETVDIIDSDYDFTSYRKIGDFDRGNRKLMSERKAYDTTYFENNRTFRKVAGAKNLTTGINMEVFSDMEAMQFFTRDFEDELKCKTGTYGKYNSFCFETQRVPNAINCNIFPSPVLRKGEEYKSVTEYKLSVTK